MKSATVSARPFPWRILIATQIAVSAIAVTAVAKMPTRLVWNVTASGMGGAKLLAAVSLLLVAGAPWLAAAAIRSVRD